MTNQIFNILSSIVVLAMLATVVKSKNSSGLVKNFFDGFSGSLKAAKA